MNETSNKEAAAAMSPRLLTDREIAPMLNVSVSLLQKDRRTAQQIPFVRIGDRCLYDPAKVLAAVEAMTVGGQQPRRGRPIRGRMAAKDAL